MIQLVHALLNHLLWIGIRRRLRRRRGRRSGSRVVASIEAVLIPAAATESSARLNVAGLAATPIAAALSTLARLRALPALLSRLTWLTWLTWLTVATERSRLIRGRPLILPLSRLTLPALSGTLIP